MIRQGLKYVHLVFFVFLLTQPCHSFQGKIDLEVYFESLKKLEFKEAKESLDEIKDQNLKLLLFKLIMVLENEGQNNYDENFQEKTVSLAQNGSDLLKAVSLLTLSNFEIVHNRIDTETFNHLTEALDFSQAIQNKPLTKQILLGILNLYRKDVIQINDEYHYFLKKYEDYVEDQIDRAHYAINNFIFQSKNDNAINDEFHLSAQQLDSIFAHIDISSKLFPFYLFERGIYNEIMGRNDMAKSDYYQVLKMTTPVPYYRYINYGSYLKLSEIAANLGDFNTALTLLDQTKPFKDLSQPLISDYYYYTYGARYYDAAGNSDQSLTFLKKAVSLQNEINKIDSSFKRSEALVAFQTLEKEKRILEQEKDILLEKGKKTRMLNIAIGLGIMLILGFFIGLLLYRNGQRKHQIVEQQKEIQKQKVESLLREQELISIDAMIAGQEKERTKVANELHDDLGSLMATVKLHFDNVKVNQKDPALKNAQRLLDEAYQKIRGMAHSKNSGVIANQGLLPAVKKMAKTISETNALDIIVEDFGLGERMENSLELTIFRIIQELVANIIKHSDASKATIQFTQHDDKLNIIVEDNGKGFDISATKRSKNGMGLGTIEKRIEHLEGSFTVDSILGKGSSILIDIPV